MEEAMSLITRNHWSDIDKVFDNFFAPSRMGADVPEGYLAPHVDIKDKEDHYEISAELPGVKKEDLHVHVEDGILTIEASHNEESSEEKDGKVIRKERRTGRFMRSFNLGSDIHDSDIKASFENGLLTLEAPKLKEAEPKARKIEIK
jgi:HSP20 family protein